MTIKARHLSIAILLLVPAIILVGCRSRINAAKAVNVNHSFDAIIVPGVPFNGKSWDDVMKIRVYWAKYLYEKGIAKRVIFSGGAVYTPYVESMIMKKYAVALGLPPSKVLTETRAEHSTENLYYSLKMAKELGYTRVALASDPVQSTLLKIFARRKNLDQLHFLPINIRILHNIPKPEPEINPASAAVEDFVPITERRNFLQRFRGTSGASLDFDKIYRGS